ncbi:MAG TPA: hypothetical protein VKZ97_04170 [Flavobacteriaceae bacterium]|nr:hypothetical protein [Flavobacteriaceae bacterium]
MPRHLLSSLRKEQNMFSKKDKTEKNEENIYIHIDHLKNGAYVINIMQNKKVLKSIKISKS